MCRVSIGNWIANEAAEIPNCTLEDVEVVLNGKEKELFLCFIRSMLKWLPEELKQAGELLRDPWLNGDERARRYLEGWDRVQSFYHKSKNDG
jgi:hypothetical protein